MLSWLSCLKLEVSDSKFRIVAIVFYSELPSGASTMQVGMGQEMLGSRPLGSGFVTPGKLLSFSGLQFPLQHSNSVCSFQLHSFSLQRVTTKYIN